MIGNGETQTFTAPASAPFRFTPRITAGLWDYTFELRATGPGIDRVVARRTGWWDAIVAVLLSLDAEDPDHFHRLMGGCRSLSNSKPEADGLDDLLTDRDQVKDLVRTELLAPLSQV